MADDGAGEGAFAEFYRTSYRSVVSQLYAYTGDLAEAQEAAQEAFIRAWARWERICEYDEPRAWVCRVAYRVAVSRWRRARTAAASWRRHGPPAPEPEPDGCGADLIAALRRLPEAQRRALVLHYLGGFSALEIAAMDGVAAGTVRSRLCRGRDALGAILGGGPDGYGPSRRAGGRDDAEQDAACPAGGPADSSAGGPAEGPADLTGRGGREWEVCPSG